MDIYIEDTYLDYRIMTRPVPNIIHVVVVVDDDDGGGGGDDDGNGGDW